MDRDPVSEALATGDVDTIVDVGCDLSAAGDHINAARCFQWAVRRGLEWATFNLGSELVSLGRDDDAISAYQSAIRVRETAAWLNLGQARSSAATCSRLWTHSNMDMPLTM